MKPMATKISTKRNLWHDTYIFAGELLGFIVALSIPCMLLFIAMAVSGVV